MADKSSKKKSICFDTARKLPPPYEVHIHECSLLTACGLAAGEELTIFRDVCGVKKLVGTLTAEAPQFPVAVPGTYCFNPGEYAGRVFVECLSEGVEKVVEAMISGAATGPFEAGVTATLGEILAKLCAPLQVEITGDSIAALQAAFTAAIETAEWPELEVTLNGEVIEVTGTVALDAATLAALEEITVNGVVGLDDATIAALVDALQGLEVNLSTENIADLVSALEAATLTVTVEGGNVTVDGTVNIGNFQELIDGLQGLEVSIPGTVEVTGTVALDPATIAALTVKRKEFSNDLCDADGNRWRECIFVNINDVTDVVGPIYIGPKGATTERPEGLEPCEALEDLIEDCEVTCQSLFQTYATAEYTITGPVILGDEDISDKFTLPVDGNNLPALTSFRDELIACLNARGINTTYQQGRDGWTIKWEGPQLTLGQSNADNTSVEEIKVSRVLPVDAKRDPQVLEALAGIKAEISCLKPDPDCCTPPDGQLFSGAGGNTVVVAGNWEGATELDIQQPDGSLQTVAVTNTVYNAATNTTTATLAEATPVKAVAVRAKVGTLIEGAGTRNLIAEGDFSAVESLNVVDLKGTKTATAVEAAAFDKEAAATRLTMAKAVAKTAVRVERITEGEGER